MVARSLERHFATTVWVATRRTGILKPEREALGYLPMSPTHEAVREIPFAEARSLKISVSHPHGNPNSYNTALAFSERGWLDQFETGILKDSAASRVLHLLSSDIERRARNRNYSEIPSARKSSHRLFEAVSRIGRKLKPGGLTSRVNWYDVMFWGHDLQVSRSLSDVDAVYAYEDGARRTFEAAREKRICAVYELPLGYYKGVAAEINRARRDWPMLQAGVYVEPRWKQLRKDAELELADVIVVASDWARESLGFSDAASAKSIVTVPYGTPADEVSPRIQSPSGPFTVLFAGNVGLRKGVPHLVAAWEKLKLRDSRLWLAGSMDLPREYLHKHSASVEYPGAMPRAELLEVMKQVDLFVFPSVAEGFGLVIGEAMACGVPVLTTKNTGGPKLITDGVEGWCVNAREVEPLVERIEWAHQNREKLHAMGQHARQRAEQWTWGDYRRKLIADLSPHLAKRVSRKDSQSRKENDVSR